MKQGVKLSEEKQTHVEDVFYVNIDFPFSKVFSPWFLGNVVSLLLLRSVYKLCVSCGSNK